MLTLPAPISDAERAVNAFKHDLLVRVAGHIVKRALVQAYVSANDVPVDIVEKEHRQGVASNAWNHLSSLEIIELLPLNFNAPGLGIYSGRIQNKNDGAKGRWVGVYRLINPALARLWAARNGVRLDPQPATPPPTTQLSLI